MKSKLKLNKILRSSRFRKTRSKVDNQYWNYEFSENKKRWYTSNLLV